MKREEDAKEQGKTSSSFSLHRHSYLLRKQSTYTRQTQESELSMTEALQRAFELAQQKSEEEQEVIAQLIFEEIKSEERWNELLTHPKSATLLEQLAKQARKEHAQGLTHDLDELL